MMRSTLLYLSTANWARNFISAFPPARSATRRFVAGESLDEAIAAARALNDKGLLVTLDFLGENVADEADAHKAADHYIQLLQRIAQAGVRSSCSLKLTQLGLDLSDELCLNLMRRILREAQTHQLSVNIDMEGSLYTERTLTIFRALHEDDGFENVSVVIQAYLYRSESDMQALAEAGSAVRICKGAYKEPAEVAFPQKSDVDANYVKVMKAFMSAEKRAQGAYLMIATHDLNIIQAAESFVKAEGIPPEQFEFQMLYGIRDSTQVELANQGYQVRVYVPYGTEWYPYFMRRLAERPANVWFILKSLFRR